MKYKIVKPNYDRSILSVSSSILKKFKISSNYPSLEEIDLYFRKKYKNIIFLILDCMGSKVLKDNLDEQSILRRNIKTEVTTVFPSTTAAATTAFHSGLSPLESGWIGWMLYFKEYQSNIELFSGNDFYTGKKICDTAFNLDSMKYKNIYKRIEEMDSNVAYHKIFPAFEPNGAKSFEELCDKIYRATETKNKINLISAYWNEPDHTIHHNGVTSIETKEVLKNIDSNINLLVKNLKDSLIIITADHGAVDVDEIYINQYPELLNCLIIPPSIESRFVTFFIKENMNDEFEKQFNKIFNTDFILMKKNEFLNSGILGKGVEHFRVRDFLGDYIAISISNKAIRYKQDGGLEFKKQIADHAGMTSDEMMVPVIIIEGDKIEN